MKIGYAITTTADGDLGELLEAVMPPPPSLSDVMGTMRNLAFIVEITPQLKDNATALRCVAEAKGWLALLTDTGWPENK